MRDVKGTCDSQMTADWQMEVIRALTNMLEEVCCSSRLACTETNVFTRMKKTAGNLNIHSKQKKHVITGHVFSEGLLPEK